jgi:hypothetical protein
MPAGGRRHELCDTCGSLRADSPRIEATFLVDHAGKELDWKGVLAMSSAVAGLADGSGSSLAARRFRYYQVSPALRLPVHWQASLPKRAQTQAAVRLCGA